MEAAYAFALWLGIITFLLGAVVWYVTGVRTQDNPRWLPRLGLGMASLGLGTLTLIQPGTPWHLASIVFGTIAIVLIVMVLVDLLRQRKT